MAGSLLTGRFGVAGQRQVPAEPKPDHAGESLEVMKGILEYLKTEPAERAKREAGPLIEQERTRLTEAARVERERYEAEISDARAAAAAREADAAGLRKLLLEVDGSSERIRGESEQLRAAYERELAASTEARRLAEEHRLALEALRAAPPQVVRGHVPAPTLAPEDISFSLVKGPSSGLLNRVVLKAKGYEDVEIDIVRGADNRMRDLKIGGNK
jgi:hypothetical protein